MTRQKFISCSLGASLGFKWLSRVSALNAIVWQSKLLWAFGNSVSTRIFTISGKESAGGSCTVNLNISTWTWHISLHFQPIGSPMCLEGKEKQTGWVIEVSPTQSKNWKRERKREWRVWNRKRKSMEYTVLWLHNCVSNNWSLFFLS